MVGPGYSVAMRIRPETPADRAAVHAVNLAAFGAPAEADLVERLHADGDAVISLVAIEDQAIVGHVMFSKMTAPFRALGLAPVAVRPDRQGQGVGAALIREGLAQAAAAGWRGVFCLGNPAYYTPFGFDVALAGGFSSPYAGPYLMALALNGPLPATTGEIGYARAFSDL